jgi:competence protein ComEA
MIAACLLPIEARAADIPDGPGKDLVVKNCGACHDLVMATRKRQTRQAWDTEVNKMVLLGAKISDDDLDPILDYLAKFFGPVGSKLNINKATAPEIESRLGLTAKESAAIVEYREQKGEFKDWSAVAKVPGVDAKKIEARKDELSF